MLCGGVELFGENECLTKAQSEFCRPRLTIMGARDAKIPNNGEPKATPTEIASRPIVGRAVPSPVAYSKQATPISPEAKLEKSIQADLGEVEQAWRRCQATHDRDAV
jgi:hypothetical protein